MNYKAILKDLALRVVEKVSKDGYIVVGDFRKLTPEEVLKAEVDKLPGLTHNLELTVMKQEDLIKKLNGGYYLKEINIMDPELLASNKIGFVIAKEEDAK